MEALDSEQETLKSEQEEIRTGGPKIGTGGLRLCLTRPFQGRIGPRLL